MLGLKSSTQVVTQGYRRFHTKIEKNIPPSQTRVQKINKQTKNNNNDNKDGRRARTKPKTKMGMAERESSGFGRYMGSCF